jgi:glutamate racemase
VVGVLATRRTVEAENFSRLRDVHGRDVRILAQACPGLVECVEAGELHAVSTRTLIARYVEPLLAEGADTLVLACTHYPWLSDLIHEIAGPAVQVIDPAPAVARELRRRLTHEGLLAARDGAGDTAAWTTGDPRRFQNLLGHLGETTSEGHTIALPGATACNEVSH